MVCPSLDYLPTAPTENSTGGGMQAQGQSQEGWQKSKGQCQPQLHKVERAVGKGRRAETMSQNEYSVQEERREDFMLLSTYGDRGRYEFNEDSRCTEIDELSTIHKPKAKGMFCSNTMHFTSSLVSTQLVRGSPSTAHRSYFSHLFQLWMGCAENGDFFWSHNLHRSSSSEKPSGTPIKNTTLANKRKAEADKIKSHSSRCLCEGGNCFFKQWAACHPQNLH